MFFFYESDSDLAFKPTSVEHAYLAILNNDLETAKTVFESIDSPRARWGKSLADILSGYLERYPTYFEIRNFLEIDMDFLLKNEKIDYIERLLGSLDLLSGINQETFKYVGRVMYENKLYQAAKKYMEKAKEIFYNDPELHYMYAKYYYNDRNYPEANFYIDECLKMLPDYYPAIKMKNKLSKYLA